MDDLRVLGGILKETLAFLKAPTGLQVVVILAVLAVIFFGLPLGILSHSFGGGIDRLERAHQTNADRIINALERTCAHRMADTKEKREVYE
jgi:hypothetical protein